MKFIGSLETNGGPVLFTTDDLAGDWDGTAGDYWALIEEFPTERICTFVAKSGIRVGVFLTETGNWSLFASREEILLVEVSHAPEGFDLESAVLDFSDVAMEPDVLTLSGFGGRIVLFDAALSGDSLQLASGAVVRSRPRLGGWNPPDTAVIEIDRGTWTVSTFVHEDDEAEVRLDGALFQLVDGTAEDE
jgi:hypothetical protein